MTAGGDLYCPFHGNRLIGGTGARTAWQSFVCPIDHHRFIFETEESGLAVIVEYPHTRVVKRKTTRRARASSLTG